MKYEGFANYETWGMTALIDNDRGLYETAREYAEEARDESRSKEAAVERLAEKLESFFEEDMPKLPAGLWNDVLRRHFDAIEWREIAEHQLEEDPE